MRIFDLHSITYHAQDTEKQGEIVLKFIYSTLIRAHLKLLSLLHNGVPKSTVRLHQVIDRLHRMDHGTMIPSAKVVAD